MSVYPRSSLLLTGPDPFRKSLCLGMTLWPPASPWLHTTVLPTYPPSDTRFGAISGGEYDSVLLGTRMDLLQIEGGLRLSTMAVAVASAVRCVSYASLVAEVLFFFLILHNGCHWRGSALDEEMRAARQGPGVP